MVAGRTHAQRGILEVDTSDRTAYGSIESLSEGTKRELAGQFDRMRRNEPGSQRRTHAINQLADSLATLFDESLMV